MTLGAAPEALAIGYLRNQRLLGSIDEIVSVQVDWDVDAVVVNTRHGLKDLDAKMGGLQASDLIIVAGRPGMGKTALATNIAYNIAKAHRGETRPDGHIATVDGGIVGFFSLEMSAEQLGFRIQCAADAMVGFLAPRFVTTTVIVALVFGVASLIV